MSALLAWLLGVWPLTGGELLLSVGGAALALLVGAALALPALAWLSAGGVRRRGLQALLLLPAGVALAWALAGPRWVRRAGWWEEGRFVVLVDDSASMGVREGDAARSAGVAAALAAIGHPEAERFHFGGDLATGDALGFDQPETDLGLALRAISERYAGERLAGIAVVSDGLDRGALGAAWRAGEPLDPPDLPGPLSLYAVGRPGALTDLAVASVSTGGFGFLRTPFEIGVTLAGAGFAGRRIPVTLSCDGALVARREIDLDDQGHAETSFSVTPTSVGRHAYRVEVPHQVDDAVPGNDAADVVIRVVRDRLRVLQVCGSPSMDEKFMRRFLKQDPAVDLVSFFILRTHEDMGSGYGDDELALIPFPYDRLFEEELETFDLAIFQNFDYAPYLGWRGEGLLENVADWVRAGGALVMVGGDRSFDLGEYHGTAVEEVLPVRLGLPRERAVDLAPFQPRLTAAGRLHPVTALASDPAESQAAWDALAPLDGLNRTLGAAPGATVLLAHPDLEGDDGAPLPVVAVRAVGKGRSLAFAGDSSWRWAFAEAGKGGTNLAYLRFWKHAMRWLVGDPEAQRVTVATARENHGLGDEVRLVVRVRDAAFEPEPGVRVRGRIIAPDLGAAAALSTPGLEPDGRFELVSDERGEATLALPAVAPGAWRVEAEALDAAGRVFFQGGTVYAVTERQPELESPAPDPAFLQALAAATGGTCFLPEAYDAPATDPDARRRVEQVDEVPLGPVPLVALIAGLFASSSWWVRRRAGGR
ncbi:MAG: glutamine amidotransferase [Pseudomonadota bacterium]